MRKAEKYKGLGYFDFIWQPASNPAVTDYFKLDVAPRGVLVIKPGKKSSLKLHDIILEVGGFPIDIQGDYLDPDYGHVIMEYLACRNKWAGEIVKLKSGEMAKCSIWTTITQGRFFGKPRDGPAQ